MKVMKACLGLAVALTLALAASGCSGGCPIHRLLMGGKKVTQAPGPQTVCPVMGGAINKKLYVDSEGKRIYVCCPGCLATVRNDPAKYIKQLEGAGVVLDKVPPAQP